MRLHLNMKIHDLLKEHPFLLEYLAGYAPEFQKLRNPVTRATLGRVATVEMAAKMGGKDPHVFLADIALAIRERAGAAVAPEDAEELSAEDEAARRDVLKGIIRELHAGAKVEELRERFALVLQDVGPMEIGRMENELIAEGLPAAEVRRLCDVHVAVFQPALEGQSAPQLPPGHPVHTFMAENRAFERLAGGLSEELSFLGDPPDPAKFSHRGRGVVAQLAELGAIDLHYTRKENLVFPLLEKAGIGGPSQVMWAVHDDIRALLKEVRAAAESADLPALAREGPRLVQAVRDMIFKEENILFPMCLELVSDSDWAGVRDAEAEIGYALVQPGTEWRPSAAGAAEEPAARTLSRLPLDTGLLSLEQVNLILNHLPLEISFIDENDEVRYYSRGEERIFPRAPQVIGRRVQNCHPPKSLPVVNRIVEEFRTGTKDSAEFWIPFKEKFLYIRYFAVRDGRGEYRGTLEVTQDVGPMRQLTGERRLLDWE